MKIWLRSKEKSSVEFPVNELGSIMGYHQVRRTSPSTLVCGGRHLDVQMCEKAHAFFVGALWGFRGSRTGASRPPSSQTKWAGSGSSAAGASSGSCGGTASWSSEENSSTSLRRR